MAFPAVIESKGREALWMLAVYSELLNCLVRAAVLGGLVLFYPLQNLVRRPELLIERSGVVKKAMIHLSSFIR